MGLQCNWIFEALACGQLSQVVDFEANISLFQYEMSLKERQSVSNIK